MVVACSSQDLPVVILALLYDGLVVAGSNPDLPVVILALLYGILVVASSCPDLPVVILALLYDGLVVAGSAEEGLASLACEGPEVETCRWLLTYSTLLILQRVQLLHLNK